MKKGDTYINIYKHWSLPLGVIVVIEDVSLGTVYYAYNYSISYEGAEEVIVTYHTENKASSIELFEKRFTKSVYNE